MPMYIIFPPRLYFFSISIFLKIIFGEGGSGKGTKGPVSMTHTHTRDGGILVSAPPYSNGEREDAERSGVDRLLSSLQRGRIPSSYVLMRCLFFGATLRQQASVRFCTPGPKGNSLSRTREM